jgi:predicted RNA-binding protein with EMAP domain
VDYQTLFNLAVTAAAFFGGWTLNRIYIAIDRLDSDVRDLPVKYVGKDDYRNDLKDIKEQLSKIIDKLDDKADK